MNLPPSILRTCTTCRLEKDITQFPFCTSRHDKRRVTCRRCESTARLTRKNPGVLFGDAKLRKKEKQRLRSAEQRRDSKFRAKYIHIDSRKSDKKRGLEHTLSVEQIAELIANECSYCGDREMRMTLDRKDNAKGHTTDNVVPACYRCNLIRRDMPYDAWLHVAPAIRDTRERGLFCDWIGGVNKAVQITIVGG